MTLRIWTSLDSDGRDEITERLRTLRVQATVPPKAVRGRERPAAGAIGLLHAGIVGAGLALLDHPLLTDGGNIVIMVAGLIAIGMVVGWFLWTLGAVSPAVVVGSVLLGAIVGDLIAPPAVATFEEHTIIVGTSTLAVYAKAWPMLLTGSAVIGLAERLLVADSLSRAWSLPVSQYRALAIGCLVGVLHVVTVFALVERSMGEVSVGLLEFSGLGAFITGLVATYAFLHWQYLLAPAFALALMVVVGLHAAWPTPGDAALGYGYVQPVVIVGFFAVAGIERGWRTLRDRFG